MANTVIELDPVTHITAGAVGKPGQRTFFIQAEKGLERVSLVCEKEQVQALADAVDEMVTNLEQEFGLARHEGLKLDEAAMQVKEPAEPLFRVGAMGLGYDANRDKILLVAQEAVGEEDEEHDPARCVSSPPGPRCSWSASMPARSSARAGTPTRSSCSPKRTSAATATAIHKRPRRAIWGLPVREAPFHLAPG